MGAAIDTQHNEFCTEVRRRRLEAGLTLEQLAERSGLTPNYIGTIENGKRDPSLSTVIAIAAGLSVQPGELFGGVPGLTAAGMEAAQLYEKVAPELQSAVSGLLRAVKKRRP
jgi:transcriptional regulator with XRE-family HTH domain